MRSTSESEPPRAWGERLRRLLRGSSLPEPESERERALDAVAAIAAALTRARDLETVARPLVEQAQALFGVEFAAVTIVNQDASEATGVLARLGDADADWWADMRLDLRDEPSGIASAVFDAAPVSIFDVSASPRVSRRLVEQTGAKSGVWVPILAEERVVGVLTVASTARKRAFGSQEISLLQALAGEVALALEHLRSMDALAAALERERAVAAIARAIRVERGADDLVRVAAGELQRALGLERISIGLESKRPRIEYERGVPLSDDERVLIETVASEIEAALETTRLLRENRRRIEQQSALLHAAQVVTTELELDAVLERLVEEVTKLLRADAADCYLLDPERSVLRCAAVHGLDPTLVGFEFAADRGVAALAIERERPVAVNDYGELPEQVPHGAYAGFAHALVAPMIWGGVVRGVLGVGVRAQAEPAFEQNDLDLLEAFARLASLALRNAESFAERTRQARVERAFSRIASLLSESLSLAKTMDAAARAAVEALGGDFAAVLMPEGGRLAISSRHGLPDELSALELPPVLREAAGDGRVVAAPDIRGDARFGDEWRTGPFGALLAIPVAGSEPGLVTVFFAESRSFAPEDLELARHVAQATRAALERSRAFESERIARALSQQLARTGSNLATELDPVAVLEEVVEQATALLGADAGSVALLEDGEFVFGAVAGGVLDDVVGERGPSTGWFAGDVVQMRAPVVRRDIADDDAEARRDAIVAQGYRAYLGVPLAAREGPVRGVLAVYATEPRTWREEEIESLAALAGNASVALENAELYQRVALEHEQSAAILANVADGIVAVDRDGRVVVWNAAAERITGVPAAEALARTPLEVVHRELESESGGTNRLVPIMRGGEEVWLSLSEALMRDPSGAVAGRIFAFRDISAERVVDRMKSDFVSTVSHELRTPLTSIYGFAETLLRRDIEFTDVERGTFLRYIASESERLTEIVDALLNVARLDSGTLQVELVPTDLGELLNEAVSETSVPAITNGHQFVLDLEDDVPEVRADPDKLRQVLGQLVENAVKYSPAGAIVRVEARKRSDSVEVTVADEGGGIAEMHVSRVFDKFYRASETHPGTGLGLFIAQGLVSAMGGTIWVRSEEGSGSRFTFALPVA